MFKVLEMVELDIFCMSIVRENNNIFPERDMVRISWRSNFFPQITFIPENMGWPFLSP